MQNNYGIKKVIIKNNVDLYHLERITFYFDR